MKKKEQIDARDIVNSLFKDVLANFFTITFLAVLAMLWMMMA
jgi:hypothetical protein